MTDINAPLADTRHNTRLTEVCRWADKIAPHRSRWRARSRYFHKADENYLRFLIPENLRVLELGCGTGDTLAALKPQFGVGIDVSSEMIQVAMDTHPKLQFRILDIEEPGTLTDIQQLGPFDVVLLDSTLGFLSDIQRFLERLIPLCSPETRVIVASHSYVWEPLFMLSLIHI